VAKRGTEAAVNIMTSWQHVVKQAAEEAIGAPLCELEGLGGEMVTRDPAERIGLETLKSLLAAL
jgi:hypothetical protein